MRKDLTEIAVVLDASGSMNSIREDAVGGFNAFVDEQKKVPGDARLTAIFFDSDRYLKWQDGIDVKACPVLGDEYLPGAMTPLLDAVGRTINELGNRLKTTPAAKRPDKVLMMIVTDGMENASSEFTKVQVKQMIEHQQKAYKWEFVFLGANIDAFEQGEALGIRREHIASYSPSGKGIRSSFRQMSGSAAQYRSARKIEGFGRAIAEDEDHD